MNHRDKRNSILITRAPLDHMTGTSYEKPRQYLPGWQFWIMLSAVAWVLVAFFTIEITKIETLRIVNERMAQIEADHRELNKLLWRE